MDINIKRIAELASLEIDEADESRFAEQFKDIVEMVSELPALADDESALHPMALREDVIEEMSYTGSMEVLSRISVTHKVLM